MMLINRSNYFEKSQAIFTQITDDRLRTLLIENGMDENNFTYEGQEFIFDFHSYSKRHDSRSIYFVSTVNDKEVLYRVSDHWSREVTRNNSSTQTKVCGKIRYCYWALELAKSSAASAIAGMCSFDDMTLHTANKNFVRDCESIARC
ncbi:hypothetical protein QUN99_003341 [Vibrio parahaemolyticus]|nr:hypothetical protein [Vibrio parahaemolyticus]